MAAAPTTLTTPRGDVVTMTYAKDRAAFGYYTDRKDNLTYTQLETVARSFLVRNSLPDLAREAYADRRIRATDPVVVVEAVAAHQAPAPAAKSGSGGGGGIFAMFRKYNRKPEDAPKNAPLEYTRFVYLGTMRDYDAPVKVTWDADCCDQPYENIDYADFKLKCRTTNAVDAVDAVDAVSTSGSPEHAHSSQSETETEPDDE